jgi:hypothetical protein
VQDTSDSLRPEFWLLTHAISTLQDGNEAPKEDVKMSKKDLKKEAKAAEKAAKVLNFPFSSETKRPTGHTQSFPRKT